MAFKTIEAPRDNGNHALTQHCGAFACVFCGDVCAGIFAVAMASSRCNARKDPIQLISLEAFDAIWLRGSNAPISFGIKDDKRTIEIAGYRFQENS